MSNVAAVHEANEQIVERIQAGIDPAANMLLLWEQNKRFVFQHVKKYAGFAEIDDLMQEGYMALHGAAMHYSPDQGATFLHYASFWIVAKCKRYIDDNSKSIRIPVHAQTDIRKYEKLVSEFQKQLNRKPTEIEIRAFLGFDRKKVQEIQKNQNTGKIRSLEERIFGNDEDITLGDTVASENVAMEGVERELDHESMSIELWNAIDSLPEREASVIRMRYKDRLTLKETGQQLGVTTERARVIESSAFRKLRIPSKCEGYKDYFEQYISASPIHHVGVSKFQRTWTSAVEAEVLEMERRLHPPYHNANDNQWRPV